MFVSGQVLLSRGNFFHSRNVTEHTLNGDTKVSLVLSRRVGDHTGVLPFMGQHGILYEEQVATLLNASMEVSSQQLKT